MPARRLFAGEQPGPLLIRSILRSTGEERWLVARASPIADPPSGRMLYAVTVLENITGVKRAQLAETFMAEASRMLASSLDYGETLQRVAQLAVPQIADLCAVDVIDERGELQRVGVHHADPGRLALARQLGDLYRPSLEDVHGVGEVIRSGEPSLIDDIAPGARAARGRDERHLQMLRGLGATGAIIVPLAAPTRTIGAMTLVSAESLRRLDEADVALAVRLGRRAGTAIERARLYTERTRITRILEAALLPQTLPQVPGVEIEALYRAAGELNDVGGDFYDVLHYGERRWMLVIGDVCGKGPHAAGVTALARHTLRTAAMLGQPPAGMLHTLHQALASQPGGAELCTVCLVTIEPLPVGARLTVALAGHPPPLVIDREGATRHIGRPGTLLGMIDPVSVHEVDAHLDAGETLLLYTDGLLDAADAERTEESFALVLGEEAAATPLDELLRRLVQTASVRSGPRMRDDVALLAARPPTAGATARL
jgi:serine phosphatase RsbU (regulator of sigma subunit)